MFSWRNKKNIHTFGLKKSALTSAGAHDPRSVALTTRCFYIRTGTLQPLYNKVRYNMVLDITLFKDGSQKCIDYIEK